MNRNAPKVSAIIIATNEKKWLKNSLQSLLANNYCHLHIVLVDNNSQDGTEEYVGFNFPEVKIIKNKKNLGFAGASNVGIKYAHEIESDYIFLVNPDTIAPFDLVFRLVEFMEKNKEFGIIGPIQRDYDSIDKLNNWSLKALENQDRPVFHRWESGKKKTAVSNSCNRNPNILEHAYVQGSAIFFRKEVFQKIGLFEEVFHTYYEETDLCRKARWAGYKIAVILDIYIQHFGGGGSTDRPLYTYYYFTRNKYVYLITDPGYTYYEILIMSGRWMLNDVKKIFINHHRRLRAYQQFGAILIWLILKSRTLITIRKENEKLYRSVLNF